MIQKQTPNPYTPPSSNPYASPQSLLEGGHTSCRREKKVLVVPKGSDLPQRCIKCNEPAEMDKPKRFSWHHPAWYLLLLIGILPYIIAGLLASKKARVAIGLCEMHRNRRRKCRQVALGLFVAGVACVFVAANIEDGFWAGVTSGLSFLAAAIVAIVGSPYLTASKISDEEAHMAGCGPAFLDSLPGH